VSLQHRFLVTGSCQSNNLNFFIWKDTGAFTRELFAGSAPQPRLGSADVRCCSPGQGEGGGTCPAADAGLAGTAGFPSAGSGLGSRAERSAALVRKAKQKALGRQSAGKQRATGVKAHHAQELL